MLEIVHRNTDLLPLGFGDVAGLNDRVDFGFVIEGATAGVPARGAEPAEFVAAEGAAVGSSG